MQMDSRTEPRERRLKRRRRAWPKWLRSKHILRWLFIGGPFVYRVYKAIVSALGLDDE